MPSYRTGGHSHRHRGRRRLGSCIASPGASMRRSSCNTGDPPRTSRRWSGNRSCGPARRSLCNTASHSRWDDMTCPVASTWRRTPLPSAGRSVPRRWRHRRGNEGPTGGRLVPAARQWRRTACLPFRFLLGRQCAEWALMTRAAPQGAERNRLHWILETRGPVHTTRHSEMQRPGSDRTYAPVGNR